MGLRYDVGEIRSMGSLPVTRTSKAWKGFVKKVPTWNEDASFLRVTQGSILSDSTDVVLDIGPYGTVGRTMPDPASMFKNEADMEVRLDTPQEKDGNLILPYTFTDLGNPPWVNTGKSGVFNHTMVFTLPENLAWEPGVVWSVDIDVSKLLHVSAGLSVQWLFRRHVYHRNILMFFMHTLGVFADSNRSYKCTFKLKLPKDLKSTMILDADFNCYMAQGTGELRFRRTLSAEDSIEVIGTASSIGGGESLDNLD